MFVLVLMYPQVKVYSQCIKYTKEVLNGDILQIFSQSPRSLKGPSDKTIDDIPEIIDAIKTHNVKIVSHSPYMINLSKDISRTSICYGLFALKRFTIY